MIFILSAVNLVCISLFIFFKIKDQVKINKLEQIYTEALKNEASLSTTNQYLEKQIAEFKQQIDNLQNKNQEFITQINQLNQQYHIKATLLTEKELQIKEWEELKKESINNAKAAVFEVGQQLSQQLIELSKQENKQIQETAHQQFHKTSQAVHEEFIKIINMVSSLKDDVQSSNDYLDNIKRALLSPTSAGQLAEITLENILKASGLISGVDFMMQYHTTKDDGSSLRPDAVLFLPNNNLIIIDSKASKFFMEFSEQELSPELIKNLLLTMSNHLKSLVSKEYKDNVNKHFIKNNKQINHISLMMFVPSETALEKIQQLDKNFMNKAWDLSIFPIGPAGLVNILSQAKFVINENKKSEHTDKILEQVSKLITGLTTVTEHARKIGNNIRQLSQNYDKLAASFNGNLLPKVNKINAMGINDKNARIPLIDRHQLISMTDELKEDNDNDTTEQPTLELTE
ncbi:DNA recombination protein RmuC [Rickettsiales endosymbiont of Stachyamoeba lipophora]|uniref:DNA recombination protein RmuC n=1 Tax=Rickettsiales endosymbiont of Stachyamoeba lipophora TaxID=2486578 RepID=UPI0013DE1292|nr:DNA recombination protein RmuC [Rickettsiales endosymbiont of Stachyamoeba lipophora]